MGGSPPQKEEGRLPAPALGRLNAEPGPSSSSSLILNRRSKPPTPNKHDEDLTTQIAHGR